MNSSPSSFLYIERLAVFDKDFVLVFLGVDQSQITADAIKEIFRLIFKRLRGCRQSDGNTCAIVTQEKRPSILKQLSKLKAVVASIPKKIREKKQERDL